MPNAYSREFRERAVELVRVSGRPVGQVARELGSRRRACSVGAARSGSMVVRGRGRRPMIGRRLPGFVVMFASLRWRPRSSTAVSPSDRRSTTVRGGASVLVGAAFLPNACSLREVAPARAAETVLGSMDFSRVISGRFRIPLLERHGQYSGSSGEAFCLHADFVGPDGGSHRDPGIADKSRPGGIDCRLSFMERHVDTVETGTVEVGEGGNHAGDLRRGFASWFLVVFHGNLILRWARITHPTRYFKRRDAWPRDRRLKYLAPLRINGLLVHSCFLPQPRWGCGAATAGRVVYSGY